MPAILPFFVPVKRENLKLFEAVFSGFSAAKTERSGLQKKYKTQLEKNELNQRKKLLYRRFESLCSSGRTLQKTENDVF